MYGRRMYETMVAWETMDDEHHQIHVADARDLARRGRLDVTEAAGPELARLAGQREPCAAGMDEVELVLLLVVVRPGDDAGLEHQHVDAEGRDAERLSHLAEDAVAQLVDRPERVPHDRERIVAGPC